MWIYKRNVSKDLLTRRNLLFGAPETWITNFIRSPHCVLFISTILWKNKKILDLREFCGVVNLHKKKPINSIFAINSKKVLKNILNWVSFVCKKKQQKFFK